MTVHLVTRKFEDPAAFVTRMITYAKGFAACGARVHLHFLMPNSSRLRLENAPEGVTVHHLWENDGFLSRKIRVLSRGSSLRKLDRMIMGGDVIFAYNEERAVLRHLLRHRGRATIITEAGEHPFYGGASLGKRLALRDRMRMILKTDLLLTVSQSLAAYFTGLGMDASKVRVINTFVDRDRFRPWAEKCRGRRFYTIAYCGTVSRHKDGVDDLIRAFGIFHRTHPEWRLKIIGRGEISRMQDFARQEGVAEFVDFTGGMPSARMPELRCQADICALARPSSLQATHGFPSKLGEYISTERPCVITDVGDIGLFLKDGETASVVPPDNPEAFASALCRVADDYDAALEVAGNATRLLEYEFSAEEQIRQLLKDIE